jgi:hypothetical protein
MGTVNMVDKALISELTWRSLETQKAAFPDMPHFIIPDELSFLLRPTQRKEKLVIHVMSLAVIAETEKEFWAFMKEAFSIGAIIRCLETGEEYTKHLRITAIEAWKVARKFGAAKIGGRISADRKEAATKTAIELIR